MSIELATQVAKVSSPIGSILRPDRSEMRTSPYPMDALLVCACCIIAHDRSFSMLPSFAGLSDRYRSNIAGAGLTVKPLCKASLYGNHTLLLL